MPIHVAVVDDHAVVRAGLSSLLADDPEIEVVVMVGSAQEALAAVERYHPDVLLLDVRLPDRPGISIVHEIKQAWPFTRVLILTSYGDDDSVVAAVAAGADGFLTKTTDQESLLRTVHALAEGKSVLKEQVGEALIRHLQQASELGDERIKVPLTDRETQIAAYVSEGLSNREIADALGLSEKTVKNYVTSVLSKLSMTRRTQIVRSFRSIGGPPPE